MLPVCQATTTVVRHKAGRLTELKTPPFRLTRKQELFLIHAHCSSADIVASEERKGSAGQDTATQFNWPASHGGEATDEVLKSTTLTLLHNTWS